MSKKNANSGNPIQDILSGTAAGITQISIGYPFDTVKVRMQIDDPKHKQYKNMRHCFSDMIKKEGFGSLYRGMVYPMCGAMFFNTITFYSYQSSMRYLANRANRDKNTIKDAYIAGAYAGGVATIIESPRDLLKCQTQKRNSPYNGGLFDAFKMIKQNHGWKGIFQGTNITLCRNVLTTPFYFGFYETVVQYLTPKDVIQSPLYASFFGGAAAGFGIWGILYPLDNIKTRIQLDSLDPSKKQYKGMLHCAKKVVKTEGAKGLFRGYVPCIIRAVPVNCFIFLGFAYVKRMFD